MSNGREWETKVIINVFGDLTIFEENFEKIFDSAVREFGRREINEVDRAYLDDFAAIVISSAKNGFGIAIVPSAANRTKSGIFAVSPYSYRGGDFTLSDDFFSIIEIDEEIVNSVDFESLGKTRRINF